jgi:CYTH domain-containing protein
MKPEDLLPSLPEKEAVFAERVNSEPAAKFSVTPGAAGFVRVKFDMEVPITSAAKLMELIATTSCNA